MDKKLIRDMGRLNIGGKVPRCPLCHGWMDRKFEPNRGIFIFTCDMPACHIAIRVDDPFVNRWEEAYHKEGKILCMMPSCETALRYFCTSTGFMKVVCPKCGFSQKTAEPDRDKTKPTASEKPGLIQ